MSSASLAQRADEIRHDLDALLGELERRRQRWFGVPAAVKRAALPALFIAGGVVGMALLARVLFPRPRLHQRLHALNRKRALLDLERMKLRLKVARSDFARLF